jgi:hypothetical protein
MNLAIVRLFNQLACDGCSYPAHFTLLSKFISFTKALEISIDNRNFKVAQGQSVFVADSQINSVDTSMIDALGVKGLEHK